MMASAVSETITLKIKSATSGLSDLCLSCSQSETIIDVKRKVTNLLPSHPPHSSQKLVYSGRILDDSEVLQDFLRWDDDCEAFTFHLVCKVPQKPVPSPPTPAPTAAPPSASAPAPSPASVSTTSPSMEEMMAQFSQQYSLAMASLGGEPSDQEIAALQSLYNQYISLYMQFLASQGASLPPLGASLPAPALEGRQQAPVPVQPQAPAAEPAAAAPPAPNAALVMNAGGAAVGQEDGVDRHRDVLDWVYVVTRILLLLSIIYFHSSFLRLAAVTGLAALVYVLQNRRLQAIRRQREVEQAAEAVRQAQQEVRGEQETESEETSEQETDTEAEAEQQAPGKLAVALTFLTSLLTSIIPEQNQVI